MPRIKPADLSPAEPAINPTPRPAPVAQRLNARIDGLQAELDALRAQRDGTVSAPPPLVRLTPDELLARRQAEADRTDLPLFLRIRGDRPALAPPVTDLDGPQVMWALRDTPRGPAVLMSTIPGYVAQRSADL